MAEAANAQDLFSGTKEVAESHRFNEANLAAWMEKPMSRAIRAR